MLAALHLIDVLARFFPHTSGQSGELGFEAMRFGWRMLTTSRDNHPVAGPFNEMLQKTADECGISRLGIIDSSIAASPRIVDIYREDDLIDACTRHTYVQPVNDIHKRYSPYFSADWASYGASFGFQSAASGDTGITVASLEGKRARGLMEIRNVLNKN